MCIRDSLLSRSFYRRSCRRGRVFSGSPLSLFSFPSSAALFPPFCRFPVPFPLQMCIRDSPWPVRPFFRAWRRNFNRIYTRISGKRNCNSDCNYGIHRVWGAFGHGQSNRGKRTFCIKRLEYDNRNVHNEDVYKRQVGLCKICRVFPKNLSFN